MECIKICIYICLCTSVDYTSWHSLVYIYYIHTCVGMCVCVCGWCRKTCWTFNKLQQSVVTTTATSEVMKINTKEIEVQLYINTYPQMWIHTHTSTAIETRTQPRVSVFVYKDKCSHGYKPTLAHEEDVLSHLENVRKVHASHLPHAVSWGTASFLPTSFSPSNGI